MTQVRNFEDLQAWQNTLDLAVAIYEITQEFPKAEQFSLTNQMRRAASSISANLAEGYGRYRRKEKMQFYKIANGSLLEVKSFCYLSHRLSYISDEQLTKILDLIVICQKLISALIKSIRDTNEV